MKTTRHWDTPFVKSSSIGWVIGFSLSTLMLLGLFLLTDVHFAVNDDKTILRAFSGYQPGGAVCFHLYIHPLLAYPLYWLGSAFPGVPWYSGMLVGFLWLSNAVVGKSIVQCFQRMKQPLWLGAALAAVCLCVFGLIYCFEITYTAAAAYLGAASAAQLMSLRWKTASDKAILRSAALSLLLLTLAYSLRQMTALPILGFCGLVFLLQGLDCLGVGGGGVQADAQADHSAARRNLTPLWLVLAGVVIVMGLLAGLRECEISLKGKRDYLSWQQARIRVMDYVDLGQVDGAVYDSVGWKPSEVAMIRQWFLADGNITADAFDTVYASQAQRSTLADARTRLLRFAQTDPLGVRAFQVLLCLGAACMLALLSKRGQRLLPLTGVVLTGLLCAAMVLYLALSGRVLMRGLLLAAFPSAALLCCLFPACLPPVAEGAPLRRSLPLLACGIIAFSTVRYMVPAVDYIQKTDYDKTIPAQMDALVLTQPEHLFFFQINCGNDLRLFPDVSGGVPQNLVSLGTWERGGESYCRQLAAFGLESEALTAANFLKEDVRIISTEPEADASFLSYLNDYAGVPVTGELVESAGDLYVYRYRAAE